MKKVFSLLILAVLFTWMSFQAGATESVSEQKDSVTRSGGGEREEHLSEDEEALDITENLNSYLDLEAIQAEFYELSGQTEVSFSDTVLSLLRGETPFSIQDIPSLLADLFLGQLRQQKQMALQILVIVMASAIFANFVKIFDSSQIADISFFTMYMLISTLLMRSFMTMNQSVVQTCDALNRFMQILLPSYLVTVVMSAGTVSALGFYEITALGIQLLQVLIIRVVLPAINFFLVLLLLNQMTAEDYFSRFAELVETVIRWTTKSIFGIVVGMQAVQDSLKKSALHRLAGSIPGIGNMLDTAAETVIGSAVVIKNAVGVAGMLALVILGMMPVLRLLASILIFRLLCALIQPISEKRMVEGIASISRGTVLLLHILATSLSVFIISLAMITAAIRGS